MLPTALLLLLGAKVAFAGCKCTPNDDCWPSLSTWNELNNTINGKLIHNKPLAKPCYPGEGYDAEACQYLNDQWGNSTVMQLEPLGYSYPYVSSCPPINTTVALYPMCELSTAPVYTVNATEAADVAAGIEFANKNNIRLVIKNTGHDMVARSQGYGSLMIWIRNIRNGIDFHQQYTSNCSQSNWTGSAFTVGGGYIWDEVYSAAASHGHVVLGGDERTVGSIGGYLQGGGHSPLSRYFGLAADQVLDLTVVLASGEVVTANACQNSDLFTALRGGGGGTFGVVISATIKTYPTHPILSHTMGVVPLNNTTLSRMVNITAGLLSKYSIVSDAGFAGYGLLGDGSIVDLDLPYVYGHTFTLLPSNSTAFGSNVSIEHAKSLIETELVQDLVQYNGSEILLTSTWNSYPSFQDYYARGKSSWVGATNIMLSSRMFGKESLVNNTENLSSMIHTAFTTQDETTLSASGTVFLMNLVGGGKVLEPQPYTSMQPAWRKTYVLNEIITTWPDDLNAQEVKAFQKDVSIRKTEAMIKLTPGMGAYVNEALHDDPYWKENFWGPNYDWLKSIKQKYDPEEVFWCNQCVGSEGWAEDTGDGQVQYGPLCQRS